MPVKLSSLAEIGRDAVGLCGLAAITYGAHLIYAPAGYIVGGLFAVTTVLLATLGQKASD